VPKPTGARLDAPWPSIGLTSVLLLRNTVMPPKPMPAKQLDTNFHQRRRAKRMRDPEYRQAYQRASRGIEQTDRVIRELDSLRIDLGISKAELARRIDRNAPSIRRLFTASQARPELPLVAAIADALGAEVRVVTNRKPADGALRAGLSAKRKSVAA
jgi:ribosome-binding protein aMBF1 (putative translation factor)